MSPALKQAILEEARRLGFILAGVTTPEAPEHFSAFEKWLSEGRQGSMEYLARPSARARRADPRLILPECKSILVLAVPYSNPALASVPQDAAGGVHGRVAAYAWGMDYHIILPERMKQLVDFIEKQVGRPVPHRWYTDTGPILEREFAQRAGLGWIGKNTCLINPRIGSYILLAEVLLGLELEPDTAFATDQCGTCRRCLEACPTQCILPDRTIDARKCISYLTIELKEEIPQELRASMGNWVFGCDLCQVVCPWNRFAASAGDPAFAPRAGLPTPDLIHELELTNSEFNRKFKDSPVKRSKRRGYLRNVAVAAGNSKEPALMDGLRKAVHHEETLVGEHAAWALEQVEGNQG